MTTLMVSMMDSPVRRPTDRMSWFMVAATDPNTSPREHKRPPKKDTFREVKRRHRHPLTGAGRDRRGMSYGLRIPPHYWPMSVVCFGLQALKQNKLNCMELLDRFEETDNELLEYTMTSVLGEDHNKPKPMWNWL